MSQLTKQQIEVAVNWWASQLERKQTFLDQAEKAQINITPIQAFLVDALTVSQTPPQGDIEKFKEALKEELCADEWFTEMGTDYWPSPELKRALKAGGFDTAKIDLLPWKTRMSFTGRGGVEIRAGYGAEVERLLEVS